MAVNTWDGAAGNTNWSDAGNWNTTGETDRIPTDADDVIIPDTSSIQNCHLTADVSCKSLEIQNSATFDMGGNNLTLKGKNANNRMIDLGSSITAATWDGTVSFIPDAGSGTFRIHTGTNATQTLGAVVVNKAGTTMELRTAFKCSTLTITAGTLDTRSADNNALTVTGNTVVTGTLTGNNSTLVFGTDGVSGSTEAGALHVESSGSLTFGSGDLTAFSGFTAKGTNTVTSTGGGDILIKGRTNNGFMNSHGHTGVNITGDYKILYDNNSLHDVRNNMNITAANINYSHGGRTYKFWTTATDSTVTFTGNLNVNNGTATLNTQETGREATDVFTVTGDVTLTGDLIANDTTINFGSLTIGSNGEYSATSGTTTINGVYSSPFALNNSGTFTHNDGTLLLNRAGGNQDFVGTWDGSSALYNLTIDGNGGTKRFRQNMLIEGDLDVTASDTFTSALNTETLTVNGDVNVSGTLGATTQTGAYTFGSLGIDTGGTFIATSGTTTITTGGTVLGQSATALFGEGTFTHNNGTLVFDSTQYRIPSGGTFYNVKMTGSHVTDGLYGFGGTLLPQPVMPDGTTEANAMSILGTLEITDDDFRPYNINKLYIHNLVIGDGTGSANSAKFDLSVLDTFNGKVFVDNVTIHSDGQLLFGDGDETSSTEGSSALNIYGAFRNLGGSVDIT